MQIAYMPAQVKYLPTYLSKLFSQSFAGCKISAYLCPMAEKVTLKNISKHLNISISTVSRALKGHPDISDDTKEKVMRLASMMEYEPNTYAVSLRTNKTKMFGLIVPEISNFFYHSFIAAVEEECRKIGYTLLILQSGNNTVIENENVKLCRLNRVAGVFASISTYTKDISSFLRLEETNEVPIVFFDKVPDYEACNKVCIDDAQAAIIAAEKLLEKNKQKILALFGNKELSITRKRLKAFTNAFEKAGKINHIDIHHASSPVEAREITYNALSKKNDYDAVFSMSDEILSGAIKAVQQLHISIPDQLGILSICNNGFIPELFEPTISYIETNGYDLGKLAFSRMNEYIHGKTFVRELNMPARYVEGGSL